MSTFSDHQHYRETEILAATKHIVDRVNHRLDIIQHTGKFKYCELEDCGKALVDFDKKIASRFYYFAEDEYPNYDIMDQIPRITSLHWGGGSFTGEYYATIKFQDPADWPELDNPPEMPPPTRMERFKGWLKSTWFFYFRTVR